MAGAPILAEKCCGYFCTKTGAWSSNVLAISRVREVRNSGATEVLIRGGQTMEGSFLRFYIRESQRHHGILLWEWLLEQANKMGIRGGSAFRAMAGFGRHHTLHEQHFFELSGSLTVEVEFIVTAEEMRRLLDLIQQEKIRIFYSNIPARFDVLNPDVTNGGQEG
jgi:PII-like signaling protein